MKTGNLFRAFTLLILCCCLQMLPACANSESDWKKATMKNTPEAYRAYLEKYPSTDRVIRRIGEFKGHSIMVGEDGAFLSGMFGSPPPEFEICSASQPGLVYKLSLNDAFKTKLLSGGTLELAADYTYTDAEIIILVKRQGDEEEHTLVYFDCGKSEIKKDDGKVKSSKAKRLFVSLLN